MSPSLTLRLALVGTSLPALLFSPSAKADVFFWNSNGQPDPYSWSNHLNWEGPANQFPNGNDDDVYVSNSGVYDPILDSNYIVGSFVLQLNGVASSGEGTSPGSFNYRLAVTAAGGGSGLTLIKDAGSRLDLYRSSNMNDLDTDDLLIKNGAKLRLRPGAGGQGEGAIVQVDDLLDIDPGGELEGEGAVEFTRTDGTNNPRNDGLIRAHGGTLTFFGHPDTLFDLDGTTGAGAMQVNDSAKLIIDVGVASGFSGSMTVSPRGELQINSPWSVGSAGLLTVNAGSGDFFSTIAGASLTLMGTMNVNSGDVRVPAPMVFAGDVHLAAQTQLRLQGLSSVDVGTSFTGPGELHVGSTGQLEIVHTAVVGVSVRNDGLLLFGGEPANEATVGSLVQGPTGCSRFGLCMPVVEGFDRLTVTGTAMLDGQLDLAGIENCDPGTGDAFPIITAGSIVGQFSEVTGLANVEVTYTETTVTVFILGQCPADLDDDGAVGVLDLLVLLGAWGSTDADLNDDGTTDVLDLLVLLGAWGACA